MKNKKNSDSIGNLTLRLLIITICAGLVLGVVYAITAGPIEQQTLLKATRARQMVMPAADDFEEMNLADIGADDAYSEITALYRGTADGQTVGYTFEVVTKGYSAGLTLTFGVLTDGTVSGVTVGSHEETPGLGANATNEDFLAQFVGGSEFSVVKGGSAGAEADSAEGAEIAAEEGAQEIAALTGATITTNAVTSAANMVAQYFNEYLAEGV